MKKTFLILTIITLTIMIISCKNENKIQQSDNPLLAEWNTPFEVPPFDKIKDIHFEPAFEAAMNIQNENIQTIIENKEDPTFENTIEELEYSGLLLSRISGVFHNLASSNTNDNLKAISKRIAPKLSKHEDEISMNEKLFKKVEQVYMKKDKLGLNKEQNMLLELTYKDFVKGGAKLNETDKKRLMEINEQLSLLSLKYGDNLLAENNNYKLIIDNEKDLAGLPASLTEAAAITAEELGMNGKWVFTLHNSSALPFLQYSENRELRKEIQTAYVNKCNHNNDIDNNQIILDLVKLRIEKAQLLGYENYAAITLEDRMAKNSEAVYNLLSQIWEPALKVAKEERDAYSNLLKKDGYTDKLQAYDWRYYAEKVRKEKYDLDDEVLRPYFKLENVRDGVFDVSGKLFGLNFKKDNSIPVYHPDAEAYVVTNNNGDHVAVLYMDYHPRESKRSGAWMSSFRKQYIHDGKFVHPVITINCNFTKPTLTQPALLTFDESQTLFHEFGHALHGMLSECTYPSISGTAVPRDFVELPSQIMENWASAPSVMKTYARHYETNDPIPDELINKIEAAGHFNQGFATTELVAAAYLDMYWHTLTQINITDVTDAENKAMEEIGLIPEIVVRYRSSYFSHIFSGGYAAGYYSYTWSEVLDADAFDAFEENGLFDPETAESFRKNILSNGHKDDPTTMFVNFRGREPKIDALLKRRGSK
ncbi:MAG: M3 family metallopeptidase [Bacteroidales bacterium]|jgi:peptidyl-dipeptidase Dcp|nr:M3 family metallopeptidase [Bacteroidales bacterium]